MVVILEGNDQLRFLQASPVLAKILNISKDRHSSHYCLYWLENLSLYDRRHGASNKYGEESGSTFSTQKWLRGSEFPT